MSEKDRVAFQNRFPVLDFTVKGETYADRDTRFIWIGWQAALEYARKEHRKLLEKCEEALQWYAESRGTIHRYDDLYKVESGGDGTVGLQIAIIGAEYRAREALAAINAIKQEAGK
jgi:hypothetical protein